MNRDSIWECIVLLFISILLIAFVYAVLDGVTPGVYQAEPRLHKESVHLPTKCRKYLHSSTGAWAECMGVGRK